MSSTQLFDDPRSATSLRRRDALLYDVVAAVARVSGIWKYPAARAGDLEEMALLDKFYWLYKGSEPIQRAEKGSGLEAFFANQQPVSALPTGFVPTETIRMTAVGDLMDHPYLATSTGVFAGIEQLLFTGDIATANLECVVISTTDRFEVDVNAKAGPPLAMSHPTFEAVASRFDFLATACNHSIDFGEAGVASTIAAIRDANIAFHGVNEREEHATQATVIERNGIRVGFVSHTFGVNAHTKPAHRPNIVNHTRLNWRLKDIDLGLLVAQLDDCRAKGVDFVVAQLHWGMEFEMYPRKAQLEVAHRLAELGVDAIIGHHPHVLQPVEYYRTKRDPDRIVPIFYSLGNLTTPFGIAYMCRSGIADLTLERGRTASGEMRTYVARSRVHEVRQVCEIETQQVALKPVVP